MQNGWHVFSGLLRFGDVLVCMGLWKILSSDGIRNRTQTVGYMLSQNGMVGDSRYYVHLPANGRTGTAQGSDGEYLLRTDLSSG